MIVVCVASVQPTLKCYASAMPEVSRESAGDLPLELRSNGGLSFQLADGLDRLGRALSDPTRRAILVRLLDGTQRPTELALSTGTSSSNLSNHLACLRGCGLIRSERSGRNQLYELVSEQLADTLRSLLALAATLPPCTADGTKEPAEATR